MTDVSPTRPAPRAGRATLLVLVDGRMPTGGHAHSGGVEAAVTDGSLACLADLGPFLLGRLHTTGIVAAAFAAAACHALTTGAGTPAPPAGPTAPPSDTVTPPSDTVTPPIDAVTQPVSTGAATATGVEVITTLDAELDARTPSPAQRAASRAQGRTLLRAGRATWPVLSEPRAPHHPIALGMVAAGAGLTPADAALAAAHTTVTGPATAATRLIGLDPIAVTAVLAGLAGDVESVAEMGAGCATLPARELPARTGIRLDLLAERHRLASLRMFTS